MSVFQKKEKIRKELLLRRKGMEKDRAASKSKKVVEALLSQEEYVSSRRVLFYAALAGEVETREAIETSLNTGKRVFLPKVAPDGLRIFEIRSYAEDTVAGAFHVAEPREERTVETNPGCLDLVIVPGVAFDPSGGRLGFGRGYYDRFLGSLPREIPLVGLAFEFQVVDKVPLAPGDVAMDYIVTEERVIRCRRI